MESPSIHTSPLSSRQFLFARCQCETVLESTAIIPKPFPYLRKVAKDYDGKTAVHMQKDFKLRAPTIMNLT